MILYLSGSCIDFQKLILKLIQIAPGTTNKVDQILIQFVFQAVVYHVWREHNALRHQQGLKGTYQMISAINKLIKNIITSLRY